MNKVNIPGKFTTKRIAAAAAFVIGVPVIYLGLGFFGIAGIKFLIPQKATVYLTIDNDKPVIGRTSGDLGTCTPPGQLGCVHVSKRNTAHIKFQLEDADGWSFNRIQLVAAPLGEVDFGAPSDKLGFGQQHGFTQTMADDFYVKINGTKVHPDTNGIIQLNGLKKKDEFKLVDRNRYPDEDNALQVYAYQLEACNSDDQCLPTDPKIENEGKN